MMNNNVRMVVSGQRRTHSLTVRWNPEYLLGRFVLILGGADFPIAKSQLMDALLLTEHPRQLLDRVSRAGLGVDAELFPPHILETLSQPMPRTTPRYDDALALGLFKGLIETRQLISGQAFELSVEGQVLAAVLQRLDPLDTQRAGLAIQIARTFRPN